MPFNEANVFVGRARLRTRDIREALKGQNVNPVLIQTLEGLADNDKTQRDQIESLADLVNAQMDLVNKLIFIIETIKDKVPDINQLTNAANVLNTNANAMMKNVAQNAIKLKDPDET